MGGGRGGTALGATLDHLLPPPPPPIQLKFEKTRKREIPLSSDHGLRRRGREVWKSVTKREGGGRRGSQVWQVEGGGGGGGGRGGESPPPERGGLIVLLEEERNLLRRRREEAPNKGKKSWRGGGGLIQYFYSLFSSSSSPPPHPGRGDRVGQSLSLSLSLCTHKGLLLSPLGFIGPLHSTLLTSKEK